MTCEQLTGVKDEIYPIRQLYGFGTNCKTVDVCDISQSHEKHPNLSWWKPYNVGRPTGKSTIRGRGCPCVRDHKRRTEKSGNIYNLFAGNADGTTAHCINLFRSNLTNALIAFLSGMLPIVQLQLNGVSSDVDTVARFWGDLGDIRNALPPLCAIKVQTTTSTCMY